MWLAFDGLRKTTIVSKKTKEVTGFQNKSPPNKCDVYVTFIIDETKHSPEL